MSQRPDLRQPYCGHFVYDVSLQRTQNHSRTLKILPTEGHDVVIDVQHLVVGALSVFMLATTLIVTLGG
ncbi:hypothetical protein AB0F17_24120 [Nonomuraea sp. NPDC026600]|uniref:hypothetical protein n=1 Tax=Nonomuraea sp. NPDC026600 TaxID=3155363 RepID=UPI0033F53078